MSALKVALPHPALALEPSELAAFCRRRGIQRLSLFGSRLGVLHSPQSDVDLLVEFEPGRTPTLLDMAEMEQQLSEMLGGLLVDLRTPAELSRYFREDVQRQAAVQYDAG